MKRKELFPLIGAVLLCAIVAFILSSVLFKGPNKNTKVPTAENVSTDFPDVHGDPKYNSIFNRNALDPAQPIQVDDHNSQPFSGS